MTIENRLTELNITLPQTSAAVANYVPYVVSGHLVLVSGQLPMENGEIKYAGQVGKDLPLEEGQKAARLCALNLIAQLKAACGGNLDKVKRVVQLQGFVNSPAEFKDHPKVINGASDLMVEVFGDKGRHSRAAVGSSSLPLGVAVEVAGIFEID